MLKTPFVTTRVPVVAGLASGTMLKLKVPDAPEAALQAVDNWRHAPTVVNGLPVR
jgi:hypothetical protein